MIQSITAVFKALGEPTRLKIVRLLAERELCVCELEEVLGMSQPRVSQHLRVLRRAGIIRDRRRRQRVFFSLNPEIRKGEFSLFGLFMSRSLESIDDLAEERKRLAELEKNERVINCLGGRENKTISAERGA